MTFGLGERTTMKIIRTRLIVTMMLFTGAIQIHAQNLQAETPEQTFMKKIQGIAASQKRHKNILLVDQSDVEGRQRNELIEQAALAAGSVTALGVLLSVMKWPQTFGEATLSSLQLVIGVWFVGGLLSVTYKPIFRFFVSSICSLMGNPIIEQELFLHKQVMIEFIKHWYEFKQYTPVLLHQQCDDLYLLYLQQGDALVLTDEQAAYLINGIVMNCIKEHSRVLNQEVVQA